jgi:4-alpha-glucanotransferase
MEATGLNRKAGILLHISSLPGKYGVGDFGPEAYEFAKQLRNSGQKIWQILPLNPLDGSKWFSPYSPLSAFAGNALFISPEKLFASGYLDKLPKQKQQKSGFRADYHQAQKEKNIILDKAFQQFKKQGNSEKLTSFRKFCKEEAYWLDAWSMYIVLRKKFNKPWFQWSEDLRDRHPESIQEVIKVHADDIEKEQFYQFLFYEQWGKLKKQCKQWDIEIYGDIPVYISHDSADVWDNPSFFKLTPDKKIAKIAGVPPDYFNENGQLWNMPVYDWEALKRDRYSWWIQRLQKNLQLFDQVRLDHFRGFSAYWEVEGGSENAKNGKWIKGPGRHFFDVVQKEFPTMPFIAEDLGDVDQEVFDLRDRYDLPGMRILQFAFGGKMPKSIFIPHNYINNTIVYTGTHDNNTVKGWYTREAGKKAQRNLKRYLGKKVNSKNCAKVLVREAYKSTARTAIIPMQDVLGLGRKHRMNFPSTEKDNWLWRLKDGQFSIKHMNRLRAWIKMFNR